MRIAFAEAMIDPSQYVPLAQAAEELGFDAFVIPDSIAYPEHSDSTYPYTTDGSREFLKDSPFIDPFVLATALSAVTKRLRFHTFVIKLAVRHPVLVAKQAMSVAVMSDNRFSLGVGISPWPEDFEITGVPWAGRGARMNEMMQIVRGLMRGEYFAYQGKVFDLQSIKLSPAPSEPVPLLVGGHSEAALKRAVNLGDGWMHAGGDETKLQGMLHKLEQLRREAGKQNERFEVHVASVHGFSADGLRRLEEMGVTDAIVGFRLPYIKDVMPLQSKIDMMRMYADNVLAKFR
jgi:probable F420-dependent oxidoreductase